MAAWTVGNVGKARIAHCVVHAQAPTRWWAWSSRRTRRRRSSAEAVAALLPAYEAVLKELAELGVPEVQLHEPILTDSEAASLKADFEATYKALSAVGVPINLARARSPIMSSHLPSGVPYIIMMSSSDDVKCSCHTQEGCALNKAFVSATCCVLGVGVTQ